jgi:hypothetical protein
MVSLERNGGNPGPKKNKSQLFLLKKSLLEKKRIKRR